MDQNSEMQRTCNDLVGEFRKCVACKASFQRVCSTTRLPIAIRRQHRLYMLPLRLHFRKASKMQHLCNTCRDEVTPKRANMVFCLFCSFKHVCARTHVFAHVFSHPNIKMHAAHDFVCSCIAFQNPSGKTHVLEHAFSELDR